jgi:hypothetical protein
VARQNFLVEVVRQSGRIPELDESVLGLGLASQKRPPAMPRDAGESCAR